MNDMFTRVLLAMDLTPKSEILLPCLYSLCPDTNTEIILAYVFDEEEDADPYSSSYKKVYSKLQGYANELMRNGYEAVSIEMPWGEVFEEITRVGDDKEVDLTLVASHGKGFFRSALLGSTTFDLARSSKRPLFVAKTDGDSDNIADDDMLRKLMIPTDFSKKSLVALNLIRSLREHVAEVVFVHVVERSRNQSDLESKLLNAESRMEELVAEMKLFGIKASYLVDKGVASKKICRWAEEENVSMIAMTKTGAGLVKGLVMGATAQNVTLNSERSLLLLPADEVSND